MRRRFQFSLRQLFLLVTAVTLLIAAERATVPIALAMRIAGWAVMTGAIASGFIYR